MEICELVKQAHENAVSKGFWEDWEWVKRNSIYLMKYDLCNFTDHYAELENNVISSRLMLIVSELGEALEGLRHNDRDNFKEELADVAIRLADLCGGLEIDLQNEILKKMEKNKSRAYKHGKAF